MSSEAAQPYDPGVKQKRGRGGRNKRNRPKQTDRRGLLPSYENISFRERPSTGRPGSPHRYFEDSYDVLLEDGCDVDRSSPLSPKEPGVLLGEQPSSSPKAPRPIDLSLGNKSENPAHEKPRGNQVVHRHLNGLCIVTAGDVLEKMIEPSHVVDKKDYEDNVEGDHKTYVEKGVSISSIQYLVKVGQDSISAKGKLRTKNKKTKRSTGKDREDAEGSKEVGDHDGNVSPRDPLCQITLSNGIKFHLNCCVLGTVIELNHRLDSEIDGVGEPKLGSTKNANASVHMAEEGAANKEGIVVGDPSLILKEPLLQGHLAVIMPAGGSFPPKVKY